MKNRYKEVKGLFTELEYGSLQENELYYKIENYDYMEDFFMTITSSSDIWNFCWSQGGLTAGRVDSNHAIFPYYTADKVSDDKSYTGPYTAILVHTNPHGFAPVLWEPFASMSSSPAIRQEIEKGIQRNIYKNTTGTEVWFEEINYDLGLIFRYAWTSSAKFGLVRKVQLINLSYETVKVEVLDGCRNILPACATSDFQNSNSVLLDAYKKTDLDKASKLALFALSSIVTDKAEPSEGLFANTCWFNCKEDLIITPDAPEQFVYSGAVEPVDLVKGKRPGAYVSRSLELKDPYNPACWYQVFDTRLDHSKITELKKLLANRTRITQLLEDDIKQGKKLMKEYIAQADGEQKTAQTMTCVHHSQNVMFNIMRGGFFANNGKIGLADFEKFINQRNKALLPKFKKILAELKACADKEDLVSYKKFEDAVLAKKNPQLTRLFYEYMPLTFSRRHGDPSRPWNKFSINLRDSDNNPILNYEGNWRDIFQNWEALAWSYPNYIKNMTSKFLNAMTIEGFNPYRISREGIDWEIPDPDNPWAQIGFWGDHQVIYLQKLLELYAKIDKQGLINELSSNVYASSNVPYRIKSYAEILENPRSTILFDRELSDRLKANAAKNGSDEKLVKSGDDVALVNLTTKLLQIIIAKMSNFIPGGGIWLNTQRPEWNDANNALAGYGLSMVTLYYLYRFVKFTKELLEQSSVEAFKIPKAIAKCFKELGGLFNKVEPKQAATNVSARKAFADCSGKSFEKERNALYKNGYGNQDEYADYLRKDIVSALEAILNHISYTIKLNRRKDGLYHAYNTLKIAGDKMQVEYLQEMLEGQVAVLSAGILSPQQALDVIDALKKSRMYEERQKSYMLYPNKELLLFEKKNCISKAAMKDVLPKLEGLLARTGNKILKKDSKGVYHFNGEFRNVDFLRDLCADLASKKELAVLEELYEKTFNHQSFTGRSGTFYAYEGLGSIYWHMVSKLMLAVQENLFAAINSGADEQIVTGLTKAYYDIRAGIGFNKTPELYGAFPADPYSHTPEGQGAKQPGMTGQVKEEILTRWGELGVNIKNGCATFEPKILKADEYSSSGVLRFTWCGTKIVYKRGKKQHIVINGKVVRDGNSLTAQESSDLFARNGKITEIVVEVI